MTPQDLMGRLQEPFPVESIGWKPGKVAGERCLALGYIDARDVMNRLDETVGPENWQDSYEWRDHCVLCHLAVKIGGEWITKQDVGVESEQSDAGDRQKAMVSDALKRAAVKWGIGRYLYSLDSFWCDYDPVKKKILRPPELPAWAKPKPLTDERRRELRMPALRSAARSGTEAYRAAWAALTKEDRQACLQEHEALKEEAAQIDGTRKNGASHASAHA